MAATDHLTVGHGDSKGAADGGGVTDPASAGKGRLYD
jgi:hypothetical protein